MEYWPVEKLKEWLYERGIESDTNDHNMLIQYVEDYRRKGKLLVEEVKNNNVDGVERSILSGADVNYRQGTPLYEAANENNTKIVSILLSYGANPDAGKDTGLLLPLAIAAGHNNFEMVDLLLSAGAELSEDYILNGSILNNHLQMVEYLLKLGANISLTNDMIFYLRYEMAKLLMDHGYVPSDRHKDMSRLSDDNRINFLFYGIIPNKEEVEKDIKRGSYNMMELALDLGVDFYDEKYNFMNLAILYDKIDLVKWLLNKGYDIHARNDEALLFAAQEGKLDIVKFLVEKGVNVNTGDDENNALYYAILGHHDEVIKYLLDKGAVPTEYTFKILKRVRNYEYLSLLNDYGYWL